jgi:hypothetical protein
MSHVTKHNSEEERKSDCCKDGRIHLLITRDSVSVSDLLCNDSVAIGIKGCRWFGDRELLELRRRFNVTYSCLEISFFHLRKINVSYEKVLLQEHFV